MHADGSLSAFGDSAGLCGCMSGGSKKYGSTWYVITVANLRTTPYFDLAP